MKYTYLLLFLFLPLMLKGQVLKSDSLISDFTEFVRLLEETHPDPYTGFGGRYFFQMEVRKVKTLLETTNSTKDFVEICSAFLSNIPDQHTYCQLPQKDNDTKVGHLAMELGIMPEGLYIKAIDQQNKDLLGSEIKFINKIPINQVIEKVNRISASENKYGSYRNLAQIITNGNLVNLFPGIQENLELGLKTPQGENMSLQPPVIYHNNKIEKAVVSQTPIIDKDENLSFGFSDKKKEIMYFRIKSIMAQENYWYLLNNKMPGLEQQLRFYYDVFLKKQMPDDIQEAIKGVPSFLEAFTEMLQQMKKHKSKNLIIDLRGNTGGYTPIAKVSLYMLFGDKYLNTNMGTHSSRRISELWLKKMNTTLNDFNKKWQTQFALGDFTPSDPGPEISIDIKRKNFIDNAMCTDSMKEQLINQKGEPFYTPENIYVITDAGTFSAAFHFTFYLWKMGAKVAGVPCRQAPNTFMEGTWFNLPYTGAKCSISNSIQIYLPAEDKRSRIFYPDLMPSTEDYMKYSFDANTEVLYLLDYIKHTSK